MLPQLRSAPAPDGDSLGRYGYWIAFAGLVVMAAARRTDSITLLLIGLLIMIGGIAMAVRANPAYFSAYVRDFIPGGTVRQADPFAGSGGSAPEGAFNQALSYSGTVAWPGGVAKAVVLEISEWGLRIRQTWVSRITGRARPAWELTWSALDSAEVVKLRNTGRSQGPVKITGLQPATVFLFFCARPEALVAVLGSRIPASSEQVRRQS